jgi:tRNA-binding EMAP/Myf-like protein
MSHETPDGLLSSKVIVWQNLQKNNYKTEKSKGMHYICLPKPNLP